MYKNFIPLVRDYIVVKTTEYEKKFDIREAMIKAEGYIIYVFVGMHSL